MAEPVVPAASAIRRHSLLKRNSQHSRAYFSSYYEGRHGPLAARQPGFRKFTTRYLQNHVLDLPDGSEPIFDGISMTTQVARADYSQGFFGEPDYENVKVDEMYLFDISATVSLLGAEVVLIDGSASSCKALFLGSDGDFRPQELPGIVRLVANRLDFAPSARSVFVTPRSAAICSRKSGSTRPITATQLSGSMAPRKAAGKPGACASRARGPRLRSGETLGPAEAGAALARFEHRPHEAVLAFDVGGHDRGADGEFLQLAIDEVREDRRTFLERDVRHDERNGRSTHDRVGIDDSRCRWPPSRSFRSSGRKGSSRVG